MITCYFDFGDSVVGDIGNADVEDKNTNGNIVNTTNYGLLGFKTASELSYMEDIEEDEDSPSDELDIFVSLDVNKFCLIRLVVA